MKKYYYFQFKNRWANHPKFKGFHPSIWHATEEEKNELMDWYGTIERGIIVGVWSYNTYKEYEAGHPALAIKLPKETRKQFEKLYKS